MDNLITIFKTWVISFNPTDEQQNVANERIKECNGCEKNTYLKLFDTYVCNACNCPISKIIFVEDKNKCKLNKWKN